MDEAKRCLNCKTRPCQAHCPVQINIPEFIAEIVNGDFEADLQDNYRVFFTSSSLRTCLPTGITV